MMCDSPEELREAAQWAGKGTKSRQDLMDKLQGMSKLSVALLRQFKMKGFVQP